MASMEAQALEAIERMASGKCGEDVVRIFTEAISQIGYTYFYCGEPYNVAYPRPDTLQLTNWPADWLDRYMEERYALSDPVVLYAAYNPSPVDWRGLVARQNMSARARQVMAEAREYRIHSGLVVPFHSSHHFLGGVTLASEEDRLPRASQNSAILLATYFNAVIRQHNSAERQPEPVRSLTDRERECLSFVALGKSNWETSIILNLSERTVKFHVENAMKKLDVSTRTQAVAEAMRRGAISV